jgi:glutamyl-tRNA reductase
MNQTAIQHETESVILLLQKYSEQFIEPELERLFNRANLNDQEQQLVTAMSHQLVNKIFHRATHQLESASSGERATLYCAAVRRLFALDQYV